MGNSPSVQQKSKTKMDVQNEFRESVSKRFNNNFSFKINTESSQQCITEIVQNQKINEINASGPNSEVNIGNDAKVDIECVLKKMTTADFKNTLESSLKDAMAESLSIANKSDFTGNAKAEMPLIPGTGTSTSQSVEVDTNIKNLVDKTISETVNNNINNEINDRTYQELKATVNQSIEVGKINASNGGKVNLLNQATAKLLGKFENTLVANAVNTAVANTEISTILDKYMEQSNKTAMTAEVKGLGGLIESFGKALSSVIGAFSLNNPLFIIFLGIVAVVVIIILMSLFGGGGGDSGSGRRRRRRRSRDYDDDDD